MYMASNLLLIYTMFQLLPISSFPFKSLPTVLSAKYRKKIGKLTFFFTNNIKTRREM